MKYTRKYTARAALIAALVLTSGGVWAMGTTDNANKAERAQAILTPTQGQKVSGTVVFSPADDGKGMKIVADVTGLTPGNHGFHIHEWGDCSAPDATSAGGHFNPTGMPHAAPDASKHHEGDFGNLVADANGNAHYEMVDKDLSLVGKGSILGRGVIVHAGEDDLKTQPTGNSGARVACGVIGAIK